MAPETRNQHQPQASQAAHYDRQQAMGRPQVTDSDASLPAAEPVAPQANASPAQPAGLVLPTAVVSRSDVGKALREIDKINDFFHQEGLRGSKDKPLPTLSLVLDSLSQANGLNMIHAEDRDKLKAFLTQLKTKAPVVHMSFPSEASSDFTAKLLEWYRANLHAYTLLTVGLRPELAAGCTVRTTNKFFDFSFRGRFEKTKIKLVKAIERLDEGLSTPAADGGGMMAPVEAPAESAAPAQPGQEAAA